MHEVNPSPQRVPLADVRALDAKCSGEKRPQVPPVWGEQRCRQRGHGQKTTPMFHYRGPEIRETLEDLKRYDASPYDGVIVEFLDPVNARPPFPTRRGGRANGRR